VAGTLLQVIHWYSKQLDLLEDPIVDWLVEMDQPTGFWWTEHSYGIKEIAQYGLSAEIAWVAKWINKTEPADLKNLFGLMNFGLALGYTGNNAKMWEISRRVMERLGHVMVFPEEKILIAPFIGNQIPIEFKKFDVSFELVDVGSIFSMATALEFFCMLSRMTSSKGGHETGPPFS
jgi:hypothetical protein